MRRFAFIAMSLKLRITDDMKAAMRAKETARLGAIRLLLAAMKQREVDERLELTDADVLAIIDKMLKQRRDSISQYEAAGRHDLAEAEKFEVSVLQSYMPQPLSEAEVVAAIEQAIVATGASGVQDMGKVMGVLKPQLAGRADLGKVSGQVKARLGQ
ncbi:MAG: GatB/YqeY domain-containing protein [Sideroxydans sp.]